MDKDPGREKREAERAEVATPVDYSFNQNQWYQGTSLDISRTGIFVRAKVMAPAGAKVYLKFNLPEAPNPDQLRAIGEVMRLIDTPPEEAGMGIRFVTIMADQGENIHFFVKKVLGDNPQVQEKIAGDGPQGFSLQFDNELEKLLAEADNLEINVPEAHPPSEREPRKKPMPVKPVSSGIQTDEVVKWLYRGGILLGVAFIGYLIFLLIEFILQLQAP